MQNGQPFGIYHIVSLLRQSAVSSLYLAAPSLNDSARAVLKVFHNPLLDDQQRQQFWREAEQLQHLRHPHIVPLLDARIHADTGKPYLVSDYVTGGSLLQHLQQSTVQRLSRAKALSILCQIGDALQYAHQQGIVHYRLKPSNILFDDQGNALLADFGISCISTQSHNSNGQNTQLYLAPECFEGAAISKLSNQYALGCIAYELLTGQTFFSAATSDIDTSPSVQIQPDPTLQSLLDTQVSPKVAQAIVTALHRDRLYRHNSIATFLGQLPSSSSDEEVSVPQQDTLVKQWKNEGLELYKQKQYEQAIPLFEQVIHHEPQNVMAYSLKAQCLLSLHRYEEVVTTCDQALQLDAAKEADVSHILYLMKGTALSWSKRHQEAVDAFDKVLQFDTEDISIYKQKIESLAHLKRYEEVVTTAEQALRIDAGNAGLLRAKGIALVQLGRYDDAVQALEPATLLNSEDSSAYLNKGVALMQLRRYEEALEALDQALSYAPDDPGTLLAKCAVLNALERHEEAIALCEPILNRDPTCLPALLSKGHALFLLKRYGEAVAVFDQIISLTPTDIDIYHTKAKALVGLGRLTEALDTLEQALTLDPENALTYYNKGFILGLGQTGRDAEAAEAIQRAYTLAPYLAHEPPPQLDFPLSQEDSDEEDITEDITIKLESIDSRSLSPAQVTETPSEPAPQEEQEAITNPTEYITRGTLLNKAGRFEEALANFEQALLLDSGPDCALAYGGKAAALSEIGTPRATLEASNQFLRFEQDHPTVSPGIYLIMATALQKVQRFDEALQAYDKAAALLPTLSDAYMGKGNLLRQLQRLEEALEAYNQALRAEPGYVAALRNKGTVLDELGQLDEALEAFNQSIRLDPNHVKGHVSKAAILYEMQRFDEAVAAHSYALRLGLAEDMSSISKQESLEMLKQECELNARLRELLYSRGSDPASNVERGRALVALPLPEEAITSLLDSAIIAFEQALYLDPNYRDALFYKGVALLVRKQPEEALDAFEHILSLQPYDFEACLQKGKALQAMQRIEEALSAFTDALAIRDDVDTYRLKIDLLCELKRFQEALDLIDHVCTLDPGNVLDYLRKAGLLAYIQRPEEALACYEKAINLQGIQGRALALAHSSRAELLCQLQNYEAALVDFNCALQLVPDDEELLLNKGLLLRHMQRHDEARDTLYQVVLSNPEILENMEEEIAEDLIEYLNLSDVFARMEEYIAQVQEQAGEEEGN